MNIPEEFSAKWTNERTNLFRSLFHEKEIVDKDILSQSGFSSSEKEADLSGLFLKGTYKHPKHIKDCNFYKSYFLECNFKDVVFENVNFSQCTMQECYLRRSKFIDCIFIGTQFVNSNLVSSDFNKSILRHIKMTGCYISKDSFNNIIPNNDKENHTLYHISKKEIYSQLKANCYTYGNYDLANYYKEKETLELLLDLKVHNKLIQYYLGVIFARITGFGYKPSRIFFFSLFVIFLFSLVFLIIGFKSSSGSEIKLVLSFDYHNWISLSEVFESWIKSFYFSTVTFTTLGYGDFIPLDFWANYILTPIEALLGIFSMSVLVVTMFNKYFRG